MDWTHWIVCERHGLDCFTPLDLNEDGSVSVVIGLALLVPQEHIIERGAKKIIRVDDEYELTNPRVEWESAA